jgi:hypothetical protein
MYMIVISVIITAEYCQLTPTLKPVIRTYGPVSSSRAALEMAAFLSNIFPLESQCNGGAVEL